MKKGLALLLLAALVALRGLAGGEEETLRLPRDVRTARFTTSVVCGTCHSNADDAGALRDNQGRPIAPYDLWQSTMMANAARDPFFLAAMAAEVAAAPERKAAIEAGCLHCHAPMASVEARAEGRAGIAREDLEPSLDVADDDQAALARDGVSCTVCHQIDPENLGRKESFRGGFVIGEDRLIYGPHGDQWGLPMKRITQYWPEQGLHMTRSSLCATCHTDVRAAPGGGEFHELTSYLEWRNSSYDDEREEKGPLAATCQGCHAPTTSEDGGEIRTRIARSHLGDIRHLKPLQPVGRHIFVGGNTLVPALLRDHARELEVEAPAAAFDATIARTREQLAHRTAIIEIEEAFPDIGGLHVAIRIRNLAGHKFPTGHASRRAWLRVRARDAAGRILWASGEHDAQGRIVGAAGAPLPFELPGGPSAPHRSAVAGADEVPVYESIWADRDGKLVFTSLGAARFAKDNRLLPAGWSASHPDAAATAPVGTDGDDDFEAGTDLVIYEIPLDEELRGFSVEAELLFQPVSPRFAAELFVTDAPDVRRFRRMYEAADRSPVVVARTRVNYREE